MKLSILICTLNERKALLERLLEVLRPQLTDDVEMLIDCDNREVTIGAKRQRLIEKATGDYVCFVDDDDMVSPDYVSSILKAIETEPDCVAITGIFTQNGAKPKPFYHSLQHKKWFTEKTGFYRSPNHLNPIKREIVLQVGYSDMRRGEDFDFSTRVSNLLKTETKIETCIYYYLSIS